MNLNRYFSLSRASTLQLLGPVALSATACLASTSAGRTHEPACDTKVEIPPSARLRFSQ